MNILRNAPPEERQYLFSEIVPHTRDIGARYVDHGDDYCVLELPYRDDLIGDPESGVIAGGAVTTLIDATCGQATLVALPELRRIATLDLRIDYTRRGTAGKSIFCKATCYHRARHISFLRAIAHEGDEGDPIAHAAGTFMVFDDARSSHMEAGLISAPQVS